MEYQPICATRLTDPGDDRVLIEFCDYRGGDSLEALAEAISESIGVQVWEALCSDLDARPRNEFGKPVIVRCFNWRGEQLNITWEDEYGCHVAGTRDQRDVLAALGEIFVWGGRDGAPYDAD